MEPELKKLHIQLLTRMAKGHTITRHARMDKTTPQALYLDELYEWGFCTKTHDYLIWYSMTTTGRAKLREIVGKTYYTEPSPRDRQPVMVQS